MELQLDWQKYKHRARNGEGFWVTWGSRETQHYILTLLPGRYKWNLGFWNILGWLAIFGSISLSIFYAWWVFLCGVWVTYVVWPAIKQTQKDFVCMYSQENVVFFKIARDLGVLKYKQEPKTGTETIGYGSKRL